MTEREEWNIKVQICGCGDAMKRHQIQCWVGAGAVHWEVKDLSITPSSENW